MFSEQNRTGRSTILRITQNVKNLPSKKLFTPYYSDFGYVGLKLTLGHCSNYPLKKIGDVALMNSQ